MYNSKGFSPRNNRYNLPPIALAVIPPAPPTGAREGKRIRRY